MSDNDNTVFVNFDKKSSDGEVDHLYRELGKAYYEGGFEDPLPELLPLFDQITSIINKDHKLVVEESEKDGVSCSKCGKSLTSHDKFCDICGTPVGQPEPVRPMNQFCSQCGKKIPANAIFCGECGAPVE